MNPIPIAAPALAISLLLAGCAAPTRSARMPVERRGVDADVFYRAIEPQGIERHALSEQEDFQLGAARPDDRAVPAYPARYLAQGPAQVEICSQVFVDGDGAVFGTAPHRDAEDCPTLPAEVDAAFRTASDQALRRWRFEPSYRCTLRDGEQRRRRCDDAARREAVPVTRAYRFVFLRTERGVSVSGDER
jgi:hypothetical protein